MSSLDPSGEIQAYPFPCKISFPDFHCFANLSWYQMGRGREVSFNSLKCLSAVVKISSSGKFKKFKTNKAVLTIVTGLKNILHWNLVKSALDKCQGTFNFKGSNMLHFLSLCAVSQGLSVPYQFLEYRIEQHCTQFSALRSWERPPAWIPFSDSLQ